MPDDDKKSETTKDLEQQAQKSHIDDLEKAKEETDDKKQEEIEKEQEKLSDMENA